jgi:hypothetical protein
MTLFDLDGKEVANGDFIGAHFKSLKIVPPTDLAIKKPRELSKKYTLFSLPSKSSNDDYYKKILANTWDRSTEPKKAIGTSTPDGYSYEYAY